MKTLEVTNLSKKFKSNDFYSLENASFYMESGDVLGLVGRNGAGKSTLLKCIAKSYNPTSGQILYKGKDIYSGDNILSDMGIMISPFFYSYMTVKENLELYLDIHNKKEYKRNIDDILNLVDLYGKKNNKPENFSFGMKQRLTLAMTLVDEPDFLIMDEPFVGLDPYGVQELIDILNKWVKEKNVSMIISSHQLNELESICNRYIMIDHGHLKCVDLKDEEALEDLFREQRRNKND